MVPQETIYYLMFSSKCICQVRLLRGYFSKATPVDGKKKAAEEFVWLPGSRLKRLTGWSLYEKDSFTASSHRVGLKMVYYRR